MNTSDTVPYRPYWAGSSLTFDNFVVGTANQLAVAAAKNVIERSKLSSNLLYVYGDVGLGKTHLLQAIANQISIDRPHEKVCCLCAERFVADVIRAYQHNKFDDFKDFYHHLDVLLIDNVQHFSGKCKTQEMLFYLFDGLLDSGKQIILAGGVHPNALSGIEPGLISRFGGGVTVAMETLDLDTRVEILLLKSCEYEMPIEAEVAHYIADRLTATIRELEGALKTVIVYAKFYDLQISVELVKDAIKKFIPVTEAIVTQEN